MIDVGSTSVLGLVAEREDDTPWRRVWEECVITRLLEGSAPSEPLLVGSVLEGSSLEGSSLEGSVPTEPPAITLSPESMRRTAEAVIHLHRAAHLHGADRVTVVGTQAVRSAQNRSELERPLLHEGIRIRVLTGEEEARYGFLSVAEDPAFGNTPILTVVDIGGASTEFSTADSAVSHPIGSLRLIQDVLGYGPCDEAAIFRAFKYIDECLGGLRSIGAESTPPKSGSDRAEPSKIEPSMVVTIGATGVNLASIRRGLDFNPDAVHGAELDYEWVGKNAGVLCRLSADERQAFPGMESGRGPMIHAGALILERCMYLLKVETIRVSVRGLRWGLLSEC